MAQDPGRQAPEDASNRHISDEDLEHVAGGTGGGIIPTPTPTPLP